VKSFHCCSTRRGNFPGNTSRVLKNVRWTLQGSPTNWLCKSTSALPRKRSVLRDGPLSHRQRNFRPSAVRPALGAGSELVVLIFEQEIGTRGQISTLGRNSGSNLNMGVGIRDQGSELVVKSQLRKLSEFRRDLPLTLPSDSPSEQVPRNPKHKRRLND
jgi:hypothetical protein